MFVDFDTLDETAKIWIYPSNRKFYPDEIAVIPQKVNDFINTWKADAADFKASFKVLYNRFIIIAADTETTTLSNADIDSSVAFILSLEAAYNVSLLDRMNVCFKQGEYVQYKELKDFKKLLKNKAVTAKTIVFDNLITTKPDFTSHWEIPIEDSWYNRFLK